MEKPETISYYEHEVEIARSENHARRWMIAALVAFVSLILTNAGWIIYENQFQDVTTTVTQEASSEGGGQVTINGDRAGAVIYGNESKADGNN